MEFNTTSDIPPWRHGKLMFSYFDFGFFAMMLLASAVIGVYFGCFGKKQRTAAEYLLGSKQMSVLPIAMSLVATNISGVALLSLPADVYNYGATYILSSAAITISCIVTCYVYLPVFYKLEITSTYEYLKLRFDTKLRVFVSFLFSLATILYLPVVIYVPALALGQVTDINIHVITLIVCVVCVFYTTLGGLKAVVWTDMLQFSITIGGMLAVLGLGITAAGGVGPILQKSHEAGRLDISFDINPTVRDTFWSLMIGWTVSSISHIATAQHCVQKFMSLPTLRDALKACLLYVIGVTIVKSTSVFTGLIMYAKYSDCDPQTIGAINKADQILPYYVMDVASKIPGLPGLFISGVFCASLSSLSAYLNSLSGIIYEDFIANFMPKDITQKTISNILKSIVVIIGVIATILVFLVENMGSIFPVSVKISSLSSGPILGIFTLGILFPKANTKGALCGGITAILCTSWILIGAQLNTVQKHPKPKDTSGCGFDFVPQNWTTQYVEEDVHEVFFLYKLSHYYYSLVGCFVCIITGLIVSYATLDKDAPPVSRNLLSPVIHRFLDDDYDNPVKQLNKNEYYSIDKALHIIVNNKCTNDEAEDVTNKQD